ncbi:hypothetical protein JW935_01675 [candidate division KSB1 bacterium]|nr:hypothetical protein [candidate division KSB1 bacterium]
MKTILWILAFLVTASSMVYQRKTGPTQPITGSVPAGNTIVKYTLERSHGGDDGQRVFIQIPDTSVAGFLVFRRYKTTDQWTKIPLVHVKDGMEAWLPHQPPAGKLEYHIELLDKGRKIVIPSGENVVTRFKGAVPEFLLLSHIVFMVTAMLVSTRAGLEALFSSRNNNLSLARYTYFSTALLFIGGMIFGAFVQKHAFGAYWTGFPFGMDLTDNKTLIALLFWLVTTGFAMKRKNIRWGVVLASVVTLVIFAVPHSMHGSELDYQKIDQKSESKVSHLNSSL